MESVSGKIPVIHIGMPKTATKTLQWRIFSQHSDIYYLGRFDGEHFRRQYGQHSECRDESVFGIMDEIAYSGFRDPDTEKCRRQLRDYLAHNNPDDHIPVWSWESYSTDSRASRECRARNLKQVFGRAKILITIRHPVRLLESAFLQQLKRDNVGVRSQRGKRVFYRPIDDWVQEDAQGDISDHLDYPETVKMYVEQFGRENVCVLLFEELLRQKIGFYTQLCEFMGIDTAEALSLVDENVDNSRWTSIQLERLRSIDRSPLASLRFRFSAIPHRKKMLDLAGSGEPMTSADNAREKISDDLSEKLLARTLKGNMWLDKTFGLGLSEHGYY